MKHTESQNNYLVKDFKLKKYLVSERDKQNRK